MIGTAAADEADNEHDSSDDNEKHSGILNQWIRHVNSNHVEIVDDCWLHQHPYSNTQQQAATELSPQYRQTFRAVVKIRRYCYA